MLVKAGLVERKELSAMPCPRVKYSLAKKARGLLAAISMLAEWSASDSGFVCSSAKRLSPWGKLA